MSHADLPQILQDLLYAEQHRLLDDPVGRAAKRIVTAGVADEFVRGLIQEPVRKHKIARAFAGPFALPRLSEGEIVLGLDLHHRPVRCPLRYFAAHVLSVGGSGSGKTTAACWRAVQIGPRVRGMWLFDFRKKGEFTRLKGPLARLGVELTVLPARGLRLNPLQCPAHVAPTAWAPTVADTLVHVLRVGPRATKLLHTTIFKLYRAAGVLNGGRRYPTLFHLREAVQRDRTANPQARQAIVDALDPILQSLQPVLAYHSAWTTDDLARYHLAFELADVGEAEKDLILQTLVLAEFTSRISHGVSNRPLDLFIVVDEASRVISSVTASVGFPGLLAVARGAGIGVDLSLQSAEVVPSILSNTANKFLGRCGSVVDLDAIGSAMGLTVEQRRYLSTTLVPGMFAGQLGEGEWRYPFLFRIPAVDIAAGPAQPERHANPNRLRLLPVEPATEVWNR